MSDMMNLWNKMPRYVQEDYADQYCTTISTLESKFAKSVQNKSHLWAKLKAAGMDDSGVLYLGEFDVGSKISQLRILFNTTKDQTMRDRLHSIYVLGIGACIESGRISKTQFERSYDTYIQNKKYTWGQNKKFLLDLHNEWPFPKSKEVSMCKFVAKWFDEPTSQVFSKIYNGQKRKFYLSVRSSDYLMISDSEHFNSCHSTHNTHDYKHGNLDYMLDAYTMIIYSGNPEGETCYVDATRYDVHKDRYEDYTAELFSPNMYSRLLCFTNGTHLVGGKAYGNAFDCEGVMKKVAEIFGIEGGRNGSVDSECLINYCGYGYDDDDYTIYGPDIEDEDWNDIEVIRIGEI